MLGSNTYTYTTVDATYKELKLYSSLTTHCVCLREKGSTRLKKYMRKKFRSEIVYSEEVSKWVLHGRKNAVRIH